MVNSIIVRAPSSTANLGPGFDVFGLALDALHDEITLKKRSGRGISIFSKDNVPLEPSKNTAGLVAMEIMKEFEINEGIDIILKKGVPAGFGMGSSAASAAGTVIAFNKLFRLKLDNNSLVRFAGMGEKASAGTVHYDNVAASTLGGFVIIKTDPLEVIQINPPNNLRMCVAVPVLKVPENKTKVSRSIIPKKIRLQDSIQNMANSAAIVVGFIKKDPFLIGRSVKDVIIEPARKSMIPGFDDVKTKALNAGALGVTISGAGPSVIAFGTKNSDMKEISLAMTRGFATAQVKCKTFVCKPSKGTSIVKVK